LEEPEKPAAASAVTDHAESVVNSRVVLALLGSPALDVDLGF
jgi:hypothetical protein